MEPQEFFQELIRKRKQWYASTRENNFSFDILLSGLYHDPSHFVYEILQNAEDASATLITFSLFSDKLEIIHNGIPFTLQDIEAITGIGNTTKNEDLTAIGKFGVGFKSVFAITQSPAIHSDYYHFEIQNFVVPSILTGHPQSEETKFVFPFDHKDRSNEDLFELIADKLQNLEDHTLLFLNSIEEIKWQTPTSKGHYLKQETSLECELETKKVEIIAQANGEESFQEFLVFIRPFELDGKALSVEIAYQFSADDDGSQQRIIPLEDSRLIVYFPTEKTTFLKFLIHGPYKTTPNRENIPLEDTQNQRITEEIAALVAGSMSQIRNLDYLDVGFLQILPIDPEYNTPLHPIYSTIFEAVKSRLLQNEEILPTASGHYASASNTLLARVKDLAALFNRSDIEMLFNRSHWLDTNITTDRTPILRRYILDHLDINEIRLVDFASEFTSEFFETKDDQWMLRFYSRLNDTSFLWKEGPRHNEGILRQKPIIRLQDNTHICPFDEENRIQAYLPAETDSLFPVVKKNLLDEPEAKKFLESLGLSPPDLFAEIRKFIIQNYNSDEPEISENDYMSDIDKIVRALSSGRESQQNQLVSDLQSVNIIRARNLSSNTTRFKKIDKVYKPSEYLEEYFLDSDDVWFAFLESRSASDRDSFQIFLNKLGIPDLPRRIQISETLIESEKQSLRNTKYTYSYPEEDFVLDEMDNFFEHSVTLERSIILWDIIKMHINQLGTDLARRFFQGSYSWFYYSKYTKSFPAKLLKILHREAWLYDQSGKLRRPGEIGFSQLNKQYDTSFSNIEILHEVLAFKSDLLDQFPKEQREKYRLVEDIPLDKLKELLENNKTSIVKNNDDISLETTSAIEINISRDSLQKNSVLIDNPPDPIIEPSHFDSADDSIETKQEYNEERVSSGIGDNRESSHSAKRVTKRLISYVYPSDPEDSEGDKPKQRSQRDEIGKKGVELVIKHEKSQGRDPTNMDMEQANHPGFDVKSVDIENQQDVRYIEVKSTTDIWDSAHPAYMTKTEFERAKEYGDRFWLYIVEQVDTKPMLFKIQNPANRADYYLFDHGWQSIAINSENLSFLET